MKCRILCLTVACLLAAGTLNAQDRARLTLDEAIRLAERNSPSYLQELNNLGPANWGVRSANASLFLPTVDASFLASWQGAGQQRIGTTTFPQPSALISQYQLALNYNLNGTTLFTPSQQKAERVAVEKRIDSADLSLRTLVTSAYLEVLRLQDQAVQAARELRRSQEHLRLAEAREEVGAGTRLETMQAEVTAGQAQVDLLVAENRARVAKLRLVHALGVAELPADQIDLVSEFNVFEPQFDLGALLSDALRRHPSLLAVRSSKDAANASLRVAKAAYLPTVNLRASWTGFTREATDVNPLIDQQLSSATTSSLFQTESCNQIATLYGAVNLPPPPPLNDCSVFEFTSQDSLLLATQLTASNTQFPFAFQNQPVSVSAFFSIPIFNGLDRQLRVEEAVAARNDLTYQVRGLELQIRADVEEAYFNVETAYQTVLLQDENTRRAEEELRLATERYQLGAGTFLELLDSQTLSAQAEVNQINARYAFHQSLADLEAAVGRPLESGSGG